MKNDPESYPEELKGRLTNTGAHITTTFREAERHRRQTEERWMEDLRQIKGEYSEAFLSSLDDGQSRVFNRMTRKKVRTISARLRDMLFPTTGDKNWEINPTPNPTVPVEDQQKLTARLKEIKAAQQQAQVQQAQQQAADNGEQPPQMPAQIPEPQVSEEELEEAVSEMVSQRAQNMERVMTDQLTEAGYREKAGRFAIQSGVSYGTGIIKGPLVDQSVEPRWVKGEGGWQRVEETVFTPYLDFVSLWDVYPDMSARNFHDVRYVIQRHVPPKHEVLALAEREDFDGEAIIDYVRNFPNGDVQQTQHEQELRRLGERAENPDNKDERFELIEYWGALGEESLEEMGIDPEGQVEVWANVWMLGDFVVKAVASPIEGLRHPYHAFYFDHDETSVFGEGVPALMRDDQEMLNASTRAMFDNAAMAAGFVAEMNVDLLAPGEDPHDWSTRKVFLRTGMGDEARQPMIRQVPLQPYTDSYLAMIQNAERWGHEHTVPAYMEGQQAPSSGQTRTASGLSMLMGAANVEIKDLVRNFDDGIIEPFITALYNWNMDFQDDDDIKGDFKILARGSSSLVAKEVRAQNLNEFGQMVLADPEMRSQVDIAEMTRELAANMDIGDNILRDPEQVQREQENQGPSPDEIEAQVKQQEAKIKQKEAEIAAVTAQVEAEKTLAEAERQRAESLKIQVEAATEAGSAVEAQRVDNTITSEESPNGGSAGASKSDQGAQGQPGAQEPAGVPG